jgi:hypothetical protein
MSQGFMGRRFQPARLIEFAWWEMFFFRLGCGLLVWWQFPSLEQYHQMPFPRGLGHWMDLTFLSAPGTDRVLVWILLPCLVLYVLGRGTVFTLGVIVAVYSAAGSLVNSQGATSHTHQLLVMTLIGQWVAALWDFGGTCCRGNVGIWVDSIRRQQAMAQVARIVISAAYLTCGLSKIVATSGTWISRTPNLALGIMKSHANYFYDDLQLTNPFFSSTVPHWMVEHPVATCLIFGPGLFIELFLFLGLLGRGWSFIFGSIAVVFHLLVGLIMLLFFTAHIWLILLYFVNVPYWLVRGGGALKAKFFAGNESMRVVEVGE